MLDRRTRVDRLEKPELVSMTSWSWAAVGIAAGTCAEVASGLGRRCLGLNPKP